MLFYGQWERGLDEKGRAVVPADLAKNFGEQVAFVLCMSEAKLSFLVYPRASKLWRKFPPGNVWFAKKDDRERIMLPEWFRAAFADKRIIWFGRGDHLEILLLLNPAKI